MIKLSLYTELVLLDGIKLILYKNHAFPGAITNL